MSEVDAMMNTIYLDKYTPVPPIVRVNDTEKWIKHVHCDGARYHVLIYSGGSRPPYSNITFSKIRCSEPYCIYNKPED